RNPYFGIKGMNAAFGMRCISSAVKIQKLAIIFERLQSVGEPGGDDQAFVIVGRQFLGVPVKECWRASSQINGHIKNFPRETRNKLGVGMRRILKMHATHRAFPCSHGVVRLNDRQSNSFSREFVFAKQALQKSTIVVNLLARDQNQAYERRWVKGETRAHLAAAAAKSAN